MQLHGLGAIVSLEQWAFLALFQSVDAERHACQGAKEAQLALNDRFTNLVLFLLVAIVAIHLLLVVFVKCFLDELRQSPPLHLSIVSLEEIGEQNLRLEALVHARDASLLELFQRLLIDRADGADEEKANRELLIVLAEEVLVGKLNGEA